MNRILTACLLVAATGVAVAAPPTDICADSSSATTVKESFSKDSNAAGWSFSRGSAREAIDLKGGNPGAFLHNSFVTAGYPVASTDPAILSAFTGDFRARNVGALGADFIAFRASLNTFEERYISVMLVNNEGTPDDPYDDCYVFFTGDTSMPNPKEQNKPAFLSYDFAIPSQSAGLPSPNRMDCTDGDCVYMSCPDLGVPCWGWSKPTITNCPTGDDANATWERVISNVDEVHITFQHPEYFSLLQDWNIGMDNPRITTCGQ
jgi:hypothetical protein